MTQTGYECTNYFGGSDGEGTCDTECQWWQGCCPCAKGSPEWDGKFIIFLGKVKKEATKKS
jgi:hypothetical protein